MDFHPTFKRQLEKNLGSAFQITPELLKFFDVISATYINYEEDRKLIERSLELSSREMSELNTNIQKSLDELKNKNEFIEKVLNNIQVGISVNKIDDGKIVFINSDFEKIYGWNRDVLSSTDEFFEKIYPDVEYRLQIKKQISEDIKSGDPNRMKWDDLMITTNTGEKKYVTARNILIVGQNLMVSTVVDTTSRRLAQDKLNEQMGELEKMNKLMIGRELKMIELKNKILSLQSEISTLKGEQK